MPSIHSPLPRCTTGSSSGKGHLTTPSLIWAIVLALVFMETNEHCRSREFLFWLGDNIIVSSLNWICEGDIVTVAMLKLVIYTFLFSCFGVVKFHNSEMRKKVCECDTSVNNYCETCQNTDINGLIKVFSLDRF